MPGAGCLVCMYIYISFLYNSLEYNITIMHCIIYIYSQFERQDAAVEN